MELEYLTAIRLLATTVLKSQTPVKTGNLRSSIKEVDIHPRGFTVTIGGEQAPYVVFVNEPWLHPRWQGRENPRQGFIDRAAELLAQQIGNIEGIRRVI